MQIHELNNKKKSDKTQVHEVVQDTVNTVGQVLKNPKALVQPAAMAQAKQAAIDQSAAASAQKLSDPSWIDRNIFGKKAVTTAAGPKTTAQVLQQVKANPATQQMIKNLAAQWKQQVAQTTGAKVAVPEAVATAPATTTQKPAAPVTRTPYAQRPAGYSQVKTNAPTAVPGQAAAAKPAAPAASMTGQFQKRPAGYAQTTINAPVDKVPTPAPTAQQVQQQAQQQTQAQVANNFITWATERLTALNADDWDNDSTTVSSLKALANKIAANPADSDNDVVEYFNQAIAANIASKQARRAGFYQPSQTTTSGQTPQQGQTQQKPQDITAQAGLNPQILQGLGAVLRRADQGTMTMPRTNNPVADAMFQQMGFKLK